MAQEFLVLRCVSCEMHQVHHVKKSRKWQCKICNQKQSVMHIYYRGSAVNCRKMVQTLNSKRETEDRDLTADSMNDSPNESLNLRLDCDLQSSNFETIHLGPPIEKSASRWTKFIEKQDDDEKFSSTKCAVKSDEDVTNDAIRNEFMFHENRIEKRESDKIYNPNWTICEEFCEIADLRRQNLSSETQVDYEKQQLATNVCGEPESKSNAFMIFKNERRGLKRKSDEFFETNLSPVKERIKRTITDSEQTAENLLYEDHPFFSFNESKLQRCVAPDESESTDHSVTPTSKWFKYLP